MRKFARISTAAFLAGVTTLAVSLPMPAAASGAQLQNSSSAQPQRDPAAKPE